MISYRIARLIQMTLKDNMSIICNVYDNIGNLISNPSDGMPYVPHLTLGEVSKENDPAIIKVPYWPDTACYLSCSRLLTKDEITAVRLYISSLSYTDQEKSLIEASSHEESHLASSILSDNAKLYRDSIISTAADIGYNIDHAMSVHVVRLIMNYNYCLNLDLGYENSTSDAKQSILHILKNHTFFNCQDLIAFINNNDLVILKALENTNDLATLYRAQNAVSHALDEVLRPYRIFNYYIAAGKIADRFEKAYESYLEALSYIHYARSMNLDHTVISMEDVVYSSISSRLPEQFMVNYILPKVDLLQEQNQEMVDGLITCFNGYIDNGFKVNTTAKDEFMHRNTVKKRLEKLHQLTGYNPMSGFHEIFLNKLIIHQYQLRKGEQQ